jgi:hypothetical protein
VRPEGLGKFKNSPHRVMTQTTDNVKHNRITIYHWYKSLENRPQIIFFLTDERELTVTLHIQHNFNLITVIIRCSSIMVTALCCKPKGCGFDSL